MRSTSWLITGERPSHCGASGLGLTTPHVPDLRIPNTTRPRPVADSSVPKRSSCTPSSGGVSATNCSAASFGRNVMSDWKAGSVSSACGAPSVQWKSQPACVAIQQSVAVAQSIRAALPR